MPPAARVLYDQVAALAGATQAAASSQPTVRDALYQAEQKLQRYLRYNLVSGSVGLALGAAALVAGLCSPGSFYRSALLLAAALELGVLPWRLTAANRRLRRVLSAVQEEIRGGSAPPCKRRVKLVSR